MQRAKLIAGLLFLAAASVILPNVADGQYGYRRYRYGYGGGTVESNYLNGMANMIRAQGQANALNAQAAINYEQARSKYLDNKKKWTENYYQMKEERSQRAAQEREKNKHSPEELAAIARADTPKKLGADALDPVTGHINWPEALRDDDYAALRKQLEQLFETRARTSQGAPTVAKIHDATREMSAKLRDKIETLPANDYMAGRKFLDSLDFAAQSSAT